MEKAIMDKAMGAIKAFNAQNQANLAELDPKNSTGRFGIYLSQHSGAIKVFFFQSLVDALIVL